MHYHHAYRMTSIACIIDAYTELKSKLAALKLRRRPNGNYGAVGTYIAFLREEPECKSTYTHSPSVQLQHYMQVIYFSLKPYLQETSQCHVLTHRLNTPH